MNPPTVNVETLKSTRREVEGLIQEIRELANKDLPPQEYYGEFLPRVVQGLGAQGGIVWLAQGGSPLQPAVQLDVNPALLDPDAEANQNHFRTVQQVFRAGEAQAADLAPTGGEETGETARYLLLLAPVPCNGAVHAVVEVFQRPKSEPKIRQGYVKFLSQMCTMAAEWAERQRTRQLTDERSLLTQEREFAQAVHEHLDRRRTAYAIANESRRIIDCDRVTVAIRKGRRCVVEAVSGQDTVEKRSDVVRLLAKLAAKVVATGEPLWYDGANDDLPPQIEAAVGSYVDESFVKSIAVIPLHKSPPEKGGRDRQPDAQDPDPGPVIGALIVEQMEQVGDRELLEPRVEMVRTHSQQALANSLSYHGLFLMPLWRLLGRITGLFRGRLLPKTLAVLGVLLGIILCLMLIQTDFKLKARGTLEPAEKRDMFAKVEGVVHKVHVKSGQSVKAGQLLVELESPDLEAAFQRVQGEYNEAEQQLIALGIRLLRLPVGDPERSRLSGEKNQLKARVASLAEELAVLTRQRENLKIHSDVAGRVATWDVEHLLEGRPVKTGDVLVTVYDPTGGWELNLYMPDKRMGHLDDARREREPDEKLPVSYILATDPGKTRYGDVAEIQQVAQVHDEEGNTVKIRVDIQADNPENPIESPRPGATVIGQVHCGRRSVGYVWFHEAGEAIQRFWFSLF